MWIVAKLNNSSGKFFQSEIEKKFNIKINIYEPKVEISTYKNNKIFKRQKPLLENYVFCYHQDFKDMENINKLKFVKGLEYNLLAEYEKTMDTLPELNVMKK